MAWSVPIWKIYGFPKVSLYLEWFVLEHATAHIHKRCATAWETEQKKILYLKMENNIEKIRQDCWDNTLDAIAYSYIYQLKIKSINFWLRISKILGIIIPVFLGGILTSTYNSPEYISMAIWITSPFALGQLVLSTILTINGADENVLKYSTKAAEYSVIETEFRQMARYPNSDEFEYLKKFEILIEREKGISKANLEVTDKEKRIGMRFGLRELSRECVGCKKTPLSMTSSKCDICGNF